MPRYPLRNPNLPTSTSTPHVDTGALTRPAGTKALNPLVVPDALRRDHVPSDAPTTPDADADIKAMSDTALASHIEHHTKRAASLTEPNSRDADEHKKATDQITRAQVEQARRKQAAKGDSAHYPFKVSDKDLNAYARTLIDKGIAPERRRLMMRAYLETGAK